MLDSLALEQEHNQYYAPEFKVLVGGQDLVRDLHLAVTAVEVNLKQRLPGQFSFTVANAFDWEQREFLSGSQKIDLLELFAPGETLQIAFGYAGSALTTVLRGSITGVSMQLSPGSVPEISVTGLDLLDSLTRGRRPNRWEGRRDDQIVREVLTEHGIAVSADIPEIGPQHPVTERPAQQTSIQFLDELAKRNSATFYVRDRTFYFGPRHNDLDPVAELTWGAGLLSFSPEASVGEQVQEVVVRARTASGQALEGRAGRGSESGRDQGRQTGSERVAEASTGDGAVLVVRAPVHTQDEANALARAILEERAHRFAKGSGECLGMPLIGPDINLSLQGVGRSFSKTWYVSEVTHTVDGQGYKTKFNVEEPSL